MLRPVFLLFFLVLPLFSLVCPPEYTLLNEQKCVKIIWTPASHWEATQNCTALSGTLVTIKNAIDNRAIVNLLSTTTGLNSIWLGMNCFGNDTSTCFWDNGSGSPEPYNNFMSPNIFDSSRRCVVILAGSFYGASQGKWLNNDCQNGVASVSGLPYMCEAPPTIKIQFPYSCLNNYDGYCYFTSKQIISTTQNFTSAMRYCYGGVFTNLTSIHSKMEVDYIRNIYKGTNTTMIYLGATTDSSGRFNWVDGSAWDFKYMDPLNFQFGNCLVMDIQNYGLWSRVDCDQKFEFVCKQKLFEPLTAAPPAAPTTNIVSHGDKEQEHIDQQTLDASNCNSTLYLAPGSISSFGYPYLSAPPSYCTWQIFALAPYRLGIYVDFWATYGTLNIFDEYGNNIGEFVGTYDRTPFPRYTPFNIATITFQPMPKTGSGAERGFHAVIMPL